jgi:hypothetical protein
VGRRLASFWVFRAQVPKTAGKEHMNHLDVLTRSIIKVGDGRGFVIDGEADQLIITAAHCLPFFPPCISFSDLHERTYQKLLAPIGEEPIVWTECLFVDPISDIAILGPPDSQELSNRWEQYNELVDSLDPISVADAPEDTPAWLLSLDKQWRQCMVRHVGGPLWFYDAKDGIHPGMSGSPVLLGDGSAIGVVAQLGAAIPVCTPRAVRTRG